MAKIVSLISRLYGEVKKNGVSNTYYKVIEKQAKNEAQKDYEEKRKTPFSLPCADRSALLLRRGTYPCGGYDRVSGCLVCQWVRWL